MIPPDPSPLVQVERAVLAQANDLALDTTTPEGEARLRALVEAEVEMWQAGFRRGSKPFDLPPSADFVDRAVRNLAGYGPLQPLLDDDDVWEIMVNDPFTIFARRHRGPSGYHDEVFHDDDHVVRTLSKILDDAGMAHRKLDAAEGLQDAQLDNGSRIHIVHGDLTRGGHLVVNIRKFTGIAYRTLGELVDNGMLPRGLASFLEACVRARCTIVFAGAPGSGKTTLLSCCAAALDPASRVVTAEEVFEVDIPLPNVASLQTRSPRADRPAIDLRQLVSAFLRMAPDVAVVGEVRDREALPLLLTLSSGVAGLTTIHAASARRALSRLRFVCQLAAAQLSAAALNALVAEAVDLVVFSARTGGTPAVAEVIAVEEQTATPDSVHFTTTDLFARTGPHGSLAWSGEVPDRLSRRLATAGVDARALLSEAR